MSFVCTQFKCQTVLFDPKIGFLSGATTPGQSGPGSDGNEGLLRIPKRSSITIAPPSDCTVSYPEHSLEGVLRLCSVADGVFYSPNRLG